MTSKFTIDLLEWHFQKNKRIMPWSQEKNPYRIWISEIILQQTRVKQGLEYYNNFISRFPDIKSLALAKEEEVFKVWEGLGYYSRCKNLIETSRYIYNNLQEKFPETYESIIKLKGIGPYTAAAISSFAYGLPHAVVDGNVTRILSRYFGVALPVDSSEGKKHFFSIAQSLLDIQNPAFYNQAIMDFGATVCKPQNPLCDDCIFMKDCKAYNDGLVNVLPVKTKKPEKKKRWFYYFIFMVENAVYIKKRESKDIWRGLYEFHLYETSKPLKWSSQSVTDYICNQMKIFDFEVLNISPQYDQTLTHQILQGRFINIKLAKPATQLKDYYLADSEYLKKIPFPKFICNFLG